MAATSFVALHLAAVVVVGTLAAFVLNELDEHYGITPQVIELLERGRALQRELKNGILDTTEMLINGTLETGKRVIETELKRFIKSSISELIFRPI